MAYAIVPYALRRKLDNKADPTEMKKAEKKTQEEDTPRNSGRQRQPPVRYDFDEYADMATAADHSSFMCVRLWSQNPCK